MAGGPLAPLPKSAYVEDYITAGNSVVLNYIVFLQTLIRQKRPNSPPNAAPCTVPPVAHAPLNAATGYGAIEIVLLLLLLLLARSAFIHTVN